MPQLSSIDKFFGAVDDAYEIILDTLKAGVDRRYRVSKGLIEQAQASQQEAVEMASTIVKSPTDFASSSGAVVQTLSKTLGRVLELSRQWLDEAMDARQEGREALRRLIEANRQAGQAVIESSRGLAGRAQERARQIVRPRRDGNSAKAEGAARPRRKARAGVTKSD